jgi:DNA-binding MarR family transcriptional regulator
MRPTNNIGYLLQHLSATLARQSDQVLQERLGIGFSQFKILMVLQRNPYIQQRQIADALGQTEASISRQIKLLHDQSLLTSRPAEQNRRQHITVLTTKGERLITEALSVLNNYHAPMFAKLSDRQQEQLVEALRLMHQEACRAGKPGACDHPFDT